MGWGWGVSATEALARALSLSRQTKPNKTKRPDPARAPLYKPCAGPWSQEKQTRAESAPERLGAHGAGGGGEGQPPGARQPRSRPFKREGGERRGGEPSAAETGGGRAAPSPGRREPAGPAARAPSPNLAGVAESRSGERVSPEESGEEEKKTPPKRRAPFLELPNMAVEGRLTKARSVSLSWGAREVGSPCEWRGRAPHCSRAMVGCRGPAPADPGYSTERRRRRRSGNHCLIKC